MPISIGRCGGRPPWRLLAAGPRVPHGLRIGSELERRIGLEASADAAYLNLHVAGHGARSRLRRRHSPAHLAANRRLETGRVRRGMARPGPRTRNALLPAPVAPTQYHSSFVAPLATGLNSVVTPLARSLHRDHVVAAIATRCFSAASDREEARASAHSQPTSHGSVELLDAEPQVFRLHGDHPADGRVGQEPGHRWITHPKLMQTDR
jgi:hypothetical protein